MNGVPNIPLSDGHAIPQLGLGLYDLTEPKLGVAIEAALASGYRGFDTAANYGTERGAGQALARSGIPRSEIFITTKLWNHEQGFDSTLRACEASLARLKQDYVDLYLIHWPCPERGLYLDSWRAFARLQSEGRVRSVGVSNFLSEHLERLLRDSDLRPVVNQIELHPMLQQRELREFHRAHGIVTEAWSPLAVGRLLDDAKIVAIARRLGRSPAQIVLRWHMQLGHVAVPKSATPARIAENIAIFDFQLSDADMTIIAGLNTNTRVGGDPGEVN